MIISFLLLFLGLILIIYAADYFVGAASLLAKRFGIPKLIIGLTVIAAGTSLPELGVNITSAIAGHSEIAVGNILGSNVANILLVLGVSVLFTKTLRISQNTLTQIAFSTLVSLVIGVLALISLLGNTDTLTQLEGIILVAGGLFYWFYLYKITRENKERLESDDLTENKLEKLSNTIASIIVFASLLVLLYGSSLVTESIINLAALFNISNIVIAGTVVAVGTSLPELITSIQAVRQKQYNLMIGNIVGSNIINSLMVLGLTALVSPITLSQKAFGYVLINIIVAVILLIIFTFPQRQKIHTWKGYVLLVLYVAFLIWSLT